MRKQSRYPASHEKGDGVLGHSSSLAADGVLGRQRAENGVESCPGFFRVVSACESERSKTLENMLLHVPGVRLPRKGG